jgi:hypothetical protein
MADQHSSCSRPLSGLHHAGRSVTERDAILGQGHGHEDRRLINPTYSTQPIAVTANLRNLTDTFGQRSKPKVTPDPLIERTHNGMASTPPSRPTWGCSSKFLLDYG